MGELADAFAWRITRWPCYVCSHAQIRACPDVSHISLTFIVVVVHALAACVRVLSVVCFISVGTGFNIGVVHGITYDAMFDRLWFADQTNGVIKYVDCNSRQSKTLAGKIAGAFGATHAHALNHGLM